MDTSGRNVWNGSIPARWDVIPLGDLLDSERGVTYGVVKPGKDVNQGVEFIRVSDLVDDRINLSDIKRIDPEIEQAYSRSRLEGGEILLSIVGTVGRTALVPPGLAGANVARAVAVLPPSEDVDTQWLLSVLRSPTIQRLMDNWCTTTVQATLNLEAVEKLPIPIPSKEEQAWRVEALATIDSKIKLNRRMNETLEELARVIFRSWFVDFDPVHAKARGEKPFGMDEETAELFPDAFHSSELGEIPEGWLVDPFSEHIDIITGGTPKTKNEEYWGGDIPWFSVKDAPRSSDVFVIDTERAVTKAGIENSSTEVMPQDTTIISARGTVGKLAMVGRSMAMNQSCYGIRGADGWSDYFTYYTLYHAVYELQQKTHGSVFDTITKKTFEAVKVVNPPKALIDAYDRVVETLFERIRLNLHQNVALSEILDLLLPRLISGELQVPASLSREDTPGRAEDGDDGGTLTRAHSEGG